MKRVHIVGKTHEKVEVIKEKLAARGFSLVDENPEVVITYGGDGIFLIAERVFPGVPKILVRDSEVGNMAQDIDIDKVLELYLNEKFSMEECKKLKGIRKGHFEIRELIGVNDIVIRNSLPTEAIRFRYRINEGEWSKVLIGDGIVVSTPYGSNKGAYFYSIVRRKFDSGIGVAFNNITEEKEPVYLRESDFIEVEMVRGIGVMVADNNRDYVSLESGDKIKVYMTGDIARRIVLKDG